MPNHISQQSIDNLTKGPSTSKISQVAKMQNYIQELLSSSHHTFLQGSYRNDTAISDINDVDIVAIRLNTYSGAYSPVHVDSKVYWNQIFVEIEDILRRQSLYKWVVERGDKCIQVRGAFSADIVPAVQVERNHLVDPIVVHSFRDQKENINYPRTHYDNGVSKSDATEDRYKPMVRMFKNWTQNHFGDDKNTISSFKTEALVHSSENQGFVNDQVASFIILADSIVKRLGGNGSGLAPLPPPPVLSVCGQENICATWDYFGRSRFVNQLKASKLSAIKAYDATSQSEAEENWRQAFNL